jgi:hypothetical protein
MAVNKPASGNPVRRTLEEQKPGAAFLRIAALVLIRISEPLVLK